MYLKFLAGNKKPGTVYLGAGFFYGQSRDNN